MNIDTSIKVTKIFPKNTGYEYILNIRALVPTRDADGNVVEQERDLAIVLRGKDDTTVSDRTRGFISKVRDSAINGTALSVELEPGNDGKTTWVRPRQESLNLTEVSVDDLCA